MASSPSPAIPLYAYQQTWLQDQTRFKFGLWARQTGKTFINTLEIALDMAEHAAPWVLLSSGQRASRENIAAVARHCRAIGLAVQALMGAGYYGDTRYQVEQVRLPNGARCLSLPANPDTSRGHSANVYLDEFAFHQDSRKIWAALFPTITRGYKLRITTTPQGRHNQAYQLWTDWTRLAEGGDPHYSLSKLAIDDALAGGLDLRDSDGQPTTAEALRRALSDDEAWEQEYHCEFLDEATAYLTYEQIGAVEDPTCETEPPWTIRLLEAIMLAHQESLRAGQQIPAPLPMRGLLDDVAVQGEVFLGFDVGRRRDLSVCWLLDKPAQGPIRTLAVLSLRRQPFWVQQYVVHALYEGLGVRRGCIDETGLGMQLAEQTHERWGVHRVEPITFSSANKEALAIRARQAIEDRMLAIPADPVVRSSLHSIKRYQTATGHLRFDAERTDATGHADHFWALALALQAASGPVRGAIEHQSSGVQRVSAGIAMESYLGGSTWR